jgi:ribosome-associated protein
MDELEPQEISKTKLKQAMLELQDLGEALIELSKDKLARLDLPETLLEAVLAGKKITAHGALSRQKQYIGRLMRNVDAALIRAQLDIWNNVHGQDTAAFHRLESWRQRLIDDDAALADFLGTYPTDDMQRLRTLIRNARKETAANKPPKSSRELFKLLREISEAAVAAEKAGK